MTSRLNQLNKRIAPQRRGIGCHLTSLRDRIPSTWVPRTTFGQSYQGQPSPPHQPVLTERVDGVLTARRGEPARRRPIGGNHVSVGLDGADGATRRGSENPPPTHRRAPALDFPRRNAVRSSSSRRDDTA